MDEQRPDPSPSSGDCRLIDAWWRAANYLSIGQIYLLDNPLLRGKQTLDHIKPRLLGHRGTTPGQNFVYVHLNRIIKARDLDMIYVSGPGHGGPGIAPAPHRRMSANPHANGGLLMRLVLVGDGADLGR